MQVTKLVADGAEEIIQGLHIFPVGMKVILEGGEYEVVDVEFMYAKRMATVVVYLGKTLRSVGYTLGEPTYLFGEWVEQATLSSEKMQ